MIDPKTIKPLQDRVLMRRIDLPLSDLLEVIRENPHLVDVVSNQTNGAHGDYRRMPVLGEIVAVGPGKYDKKFRFIPTTVKPGERVIFTDWNDWEDAPAGYQMVHEGDIWGYPVEQKAKKAKARKRTKAA